MTVRVSITLLLLLAGCDAAPPTTAPDPAKSPQTLPTVRMTVRGTPLTLQVADDEAERQKGLMFVKSMPPDAGMVFVFPGERPLGFWMENTPIDLDIIYADHDGKVVAVKTMRAYDLNTTPSDDPASYAIELNAGAAKKLGVTRGDKLNFPAGLADHAK